MKIKQLIGLSAAALIGLMGTQVFADVYVVDGTEQVTQVKTENTVVEGRDPEKAKDPINSSEWAKPYINRAFAHSLLYDTDLQKNAIFTQNISRQDFIDILMNYVRLNVTDYRLGQLKEGKEIYNLVDTDSFNTHEAMFLGLVSGRYRDENGGVHFEGSKEITRQEASRVLGLAEELINNQRSVIRPFPELRIFTDAGLIQDWALQGCADMVSMGVIAGRHEGIFAPNGYTKQEEAIKMIVVLLENRK